MERTYLVQVFGMIATVSGIISRALHMDGINERECDILPKNSSLPCIQYDISDKSLCNETALRDMGLFRDLYKTGDKDDMTWPGPIFEGQVVDAQTNISWSPLKYVSLKYLKGYQVMKVGSSYATFDMLYCTVIDLSAVTINDWNTHPDVEFFVKNTDLGSYQVSVRPLPFPTDNSIPMYENTLTPGRIQYHPNITFRVLYEQMNETSLNITVDLDIHEPTAGAPECLVVTLDDTERVERMDTRSIPVSEPSFVINNLSIGSYTLKVRPKDDSLFGMMGPCICYEESSGTRSCVPCRPYITHIQIEDVQTDMNNDLVDSEGFSGTQLSLAISIPVVLALVLLGGAVITRFRPGPFRSGGQWGMTCTKSSQKQGFPSVKILLVYASDHTRHVKAVRCLKNLIESAFGKGCITDISDTCHSDVLVESIEQTGRTRIGRTVDYDQKLVICVHSAWAHKLASAYRTDELRYGDVTDIIDRQFLQHFSNICTCSSGRPNNMMIGVKFDYTPDDFVIQEPFMGPLFNISANSSAMLKHIQSRFNIYSELKLVPVSQEINVVASAISEVFAYESQNKNWLAAKVFSLTSSPSNDDSGIVISRRNNMKMSKRCSRSMSVDAVSCYSCFSGTVASGTHCGTCEQKHAPHLTRASSVDLSFYPPESDDDESIAYSLLATKLVDINDRYAYALSGQWNTEEDCFTIDGQNV